MKLTFLTLFPDIISTYFSYGVLAHAKKGGLLDVSIEDIRSSGLGVHKQVDDSPYGGGAGMVLKPDVLKSSLAKALNLPNTFVKTDIPSSTHIVITSASGKQFTQADAGILSSFEQIVFVCGRYEGIDQRFIDLYSDSTFSFGQAVMSGGEIPALGMADSISRLVPGVLGNEESLLEESFVGDTTELEYPHFTRPQVFEGVSVPDVLLSGDHSKIAQWRGSQKKR